MATTSSNVEETLTQHLKAAFKDNLDSVTLYGSYVRGTFRQGTSDINVLILLNDPDADQIRAFGTEARRFLRSRRITPLILTRPEFHASADVFPLEYADIREAHRTIHGEDPTTELDLRSRNLRHQLEHQLRGNLFSLRQMILATRGNKRALRRQLTDWFGPMTAVFRGLVRLAGNDSARGSESGPGHAFSDVESLIQTVNRLYNLEPGPFLQLLRMNDDTSVDPIRLSRDLDRRLSELSQYVDSLRATLEKESEG